VIAPLVSANWQATGSPWPRPSSWSCRRPLAWPVVARKATVTVASGRGRRSSSGQLVVAGGRSGQEGVAVWTATVVSCRRKQWYFTELKIKLKQARDWISAHSPNFVAMATRVGPQHFVWFYWIGHPRKPPVRPKHLRSICRTSRVIGDFVQLFGSKFWALGGLNQKCQNTVL